MRRAVVLGASGGMGQALVAQLLAASVETIAFARTRERLRTLSERLGYHPRLDLYAGDVFDDAALREATRGADVIFHSVNLPYPQWGQWLLPLTDAVLRAAKTAGSRLVMIDNVYPYGRPRSERVTEDHPMAPHTRKGRLRLEAAKKAFAAHEEGTPILIVRYPDFYGPHAENTLLGTTLKAIAAGKNAFFVGDMDVPREYIYTPDGAKAAVTLAQRLDAYGQTWNIPGPGVLTGREAVRYALEAAAVQVKVRSVGRGMLRMFGIVNPMMREMVEMMYLTETPLVLDGSKYERHIGALHATPYRIGIQETVRSYLDSVP